MHLYTCLKLEMLLHGRASEMRILKKGFCYCSSLDMEQVILFTPSDYSEGCSWTKITSAKSFCKNVSNLISSWNINRTKFSSFYYLPKLWSISRCFLRE